MIAQVRPLSALVVSGHRAGLMGLKALRWAVAWLWLVVGGWGEANPAGGGACSGAFRWHRETERCRSLLTGLGEGPYCLYEAAWELATRNRSDGGDLLPSLGCMLSPLSHLNFGCRRGGGGPVRGGDDGERAGGLGPAGALGGHRLQPPPEPDEGHARRPHARPLHKRLQRGFELKGSLRVWNGEGKGGGTEGEAEVAEFTSVGKGQLERASSGLLALVQRSVVDGILRFSFVHRIRPETLDHWGLWSWRCTYVMFPVTGPFGPISMDEWNRDEG